MAKPLFKAYRQTQAFLIPPSLDELIAANHPVRVVNEVIEGLDLDVLIKKYKGGGATSYHPRMLLKVLVYGYLSNIYSSRRLEAVLKENIHFMWLAGMSTPDHHTINRFRSERLRNILRNIFVQLVKHLVESGHVSLKEVYTDGTKIESAANRYTFVWGNAIKTSKERIKKQLTELWRYTQKVAKEEMGDDTPPDFTDIDKEKVKQTIEKINEVLRDKEVPKDIKQKLGYAAKQWPAKLDQYEEQQKVLGTRNSYSKQDPDATFMRMKEDHMKNGQLKPGYNVQISTNNQFVVNYSLHQNPADTKTLIPHVQQHKAMYDEVPEVQVADAGYGSEENYQYLQQQNVEAYIKHSFFDKEQKRSYLPKYPFAAEHLHYNRVDDAYICPMGQHMKRIGEHEEKTEAGFAKTYHHYQANNCKGCPLRGVCHKQKGNRIIKVCRSAIELKRQAAERLRSEKGIYYRKKRCWDVEPVFANIKQNKNFKRFMLKGLPKVEVEWALLCIAHNLSKIAA
jgi:transposase